MTLWVSTQEPPEGMTIDDRVKLADHDGGTVSVVNRDATSAEVIQLITEGGAVVSELAMTLEGAVSFVLANGTLKRLAYLDIQGEAKGDPLSQEEESNADLILSGDAVRKVVVALTAELGGLKHE
jgi:DNA recombination-dependent growth factor C